MHTDVYERDSGLSEQSDEKYVCGRACSPYSLMMIRTYLRNLHTNCDLFIEQSILRQ